MNKINKILMLLSFISVGIFAQAQGRYFTKSANIGFTSKAPLEDIEAKNKSGACVLDAKTGTLQFIVLMKGFEFENEEMQEHFNEDYVESDKYPKAEFKGQLVNNTSVNYTTPGTYTVQVKGQLTLHGITKDVQTTGTLKTDNDGIKATSGFIIQVADYNIKIPSLVKDKVAKTVKITIDAKLDPLKG